MHQCDGRCSRWALRSRWHHGVLHAIGRQKPSFSEPPGMTTLPTWRKEKSTGTRVSNFLICITTNFALARSETLNFAVAVDVPMKPLLS